MSSYPVWHSRLNGFRDIRGLISCRTNVRTNMTKPIPIAWKAFRLSKTRELWNKGCQCAEQIFQAAHTTRTHWQFGCICNYCVDYVVVVMRYERVGECKVAPTETAPMTFQCKALLYLLPFSRNLNVKPGPKILPRLGVKVGVGTNRNIDPHILVRACAYLAPFSHNAQRHRKTDRPT